MIIHKRTYGATRLVDILCSVVERYALETYGEKIKVKIIDKDES